MIQGQLNFSRDMEREADRVGYGIYTGASHAHCRRGRDVRAAGSCQPAQRQRRLPLPAHAPADGGAHRRRTRPGGSGWRRESSVALHRARDDARPRPGADGRWRRFVAAPAGARAGRGDFRLQGCGSCTPDSIAAHYGSAMASMQLRDHARAVDSAQRAQAQLRGGSTLGDARALRAAQIVLAQALAQSGQGSQALSMLDAQDDGSRPVMMARASLATELARSGGNTNTNTQQVLRPSLEALQAWVGRASAGRAGLVATGTRERADGPAAARHTRRR